MLWLEQACMAAHIWSNPIPRKPKFWRIRPDYLVTENTQKVLPLFDHIWSTCLRRSAKFPGIRPNFFLTEIIQIVIPVI